MHRVLIVGTVWPYHSGGARAPGRANRTGAMYAVMHEIDSLLEYPGVLNAEVGCVARAVSGFVRMTQVRWHVT